MEVFVLRAGKGEKENLKRHMGNREGAQKYFPTQTDLDFKNGAGCKLSYLLIVTGCWSLCVEKSRESLPGSAGLGRKRMPQIEQAYSPVQMRLPSRFVMTALRQIFLASIRKAYTDSGNAIWEKIQIAPLPNAR